MKNLSIACLFKIVKEKTEITNNSLQNLLGINRNQHTGAWSRLEDMLKQKIASTLKRNRKDFIRTKLDPFAFNYTWDGAYTCLDMKQGLVTVNDPSTEQQPIFF